MLNATGGAHPWASGEAPSKVVQPFAVGQGASQLAFWVGCITWKNVRAQNFEFSARAVRVASMRGLEEADAGAGEGEVTPALFWGASYC